MGMADFPGMVNTQTSSHQQVMNTFLDLNFVKSVPGILLLLELVFGLLVWALVSSAVYWRVPAFGWVLFVSITVWILTITLFIMLVLRMRQKLSVPWPLVLLVFYAVASILYLTAFLANAVSVNIFRRGNTYDQVAAAAFFAIVVTLAYSASTVFAYIEWKGDGGNAAMSTVPV